MIEGTLLLSSWFSAACFVLMMWLLARSDSFSNAKRILVCDDDPLFRKTLSLLLREHGTVVTAQNTSEPHMMANHAGAEMSVNLLSKMHECGLPMMSCETSGSSVYSSTPL